MRCNCLPTTERRVPAVAPGLGHQQAVGLHRHCGQERPARALRDAAGRQGCSLSDGGALEVEQAWEVAGTADGVNSLACTLLACTLLACTLLLADLVLADGMARGCCVHACSQHLLPTRDTDPPQGVARLPGGRQPCRDAGQVSCCGLQQRWTACSASACLPLSHES